MPSLHHTKSITACFVLILIACLPKGHAVIGVPFANVKSAEKLEKAGQFAKALEARELAAEFCKYFSIPEFSDDLEFFKLQGHLRQVEYTQDMLKQFREWQKVSYEKAEENRTKVTLTPKRYLRYRHRIRRQLVGAADFYPAIHNGQLGIQVLNLERKGIVATDFERALEGRERAARLYEKVSIPYVLHAIEDAKADGDAKEIETLEAKLVKYRAAVTENRKKAEENRQKILELQRRNDPENLRAMLKDSKTTARRSAIKVADVLGLNDVLRLGLKNDQSSVRMMAFEALERKLDIPGLLHAKSSEDSVIAERAEKTFKRDDLLFRNMIIGRLIDALNNENSETRQEIHHQLLAHTDPHFDSQPDTPSQELWKAWFKNQLEPGLLGIYYSGRNLENMKTWRVDEEINFHWKDIPHPEISEKSYSIRWVGMLDVPVSDTYQIFTYHDDGVRVWINDRLVINDWNQHEPAPQEGKIQLNVGLHNIEIEFFNAQSKAIIQLFWARDKIPQAIIPSENLWHFPAIANQ